MKIDWKQKLSSRKFWAGIIGFITAILAAFNVSSLTIEQVVTIVSGIGALVVYILAESYIDGKRAEGTPESSVDAIGFDIGGGEE